MICPTCSGSLIEIRVKSIALDACRKCRGVWFGKGELLAFLNRLIKGKAVKSEQTKLFEQRAVTGKNDLRELPRKCPVCGKIMQKFNYCSDSNVFLDKCDACDGIWADKGEIRPLARYVKEDPEIQAMGHLILETSGEKTHFDDWLIKLAQFLNYGGANWWADLWARMYTRHKGVTGTQDR